MRVQRSRNRIAIGAGILLGIVVPASAQTITNLPVNGQANIFGAGRANTTAVGGGLLPPIVNLTAGTNRVLTFSSVTGTVSIAGAATPNGPDGGTTPPGPTNIDSALGISGIIHTNRNMFLTGVFLDATEPAGAAPARLSFTDPENFLTLAPQLRQTFFIGDGLTDAGSITQLFQVPDGATRFSLGFADGFSVTGPPGAYSDNSGSLSASFTVAPVPEPSTLLTAGFVASAFAGRLWYRRRQTRVAA